VMMGISRVLLSVFGVGNACDGGALGSRWVLTDRGSLEVADVLLERALLLALLPFAVVDSGLLGFCWSMVAAAATSPSSNCTTCFDVFLDCFDLLSAGSRRVLGEVENEPSCCFELSAEKDAPKLC